MLYLLVVGVGVGAMVSLVGARVEEQPYYLRNVACNCYVGEKKGHLAPVGIKDAVKFKESVFVDNNLVKTGKILDEGGRAMDFRKGGKIKLLRGEDTVTQRATVKNLEGDKAIIKNMEKCLRYSKTRNAFELGKCAFKEATNVFEKVRQREVTKEIEEKEKPLGEIPKNEAREHQEVQKLAEGDTENDFYSWKTLPDKIPPKIAIIRHQHTHEYGDDELNKVTYFFGGKYPADIETRFPSLHTHSNDHTILSKASKMHPAFAIA